MNDPATQPTTPPSGSAWTSWNAFWFTPKDPTLLCMMRILVGMVTLYTFVIHGLTLQEFMGENAWYDLKLRREMIDHRPMMVGALLSSPLAASETTPAAPANEQQEKWRYEYKNRWGVWPPSPHPENEEQYRFAQTFRETHGFDFRYYGLPFPKSAWERQVLESYVAEFRQAFPPPYPQTQAEVDRIDAYINQNGFDPRRLYARGTTVFSVWMHVTDPFWMNVVQTGFTIVAVCFLFGLGTRVTSVLVWFANLCYIHRDPFVLFGVDTMMNVLLLYLMVGPSGATLSLDRLITRWWRGRTGQDVDAAPAPSVSAGVAYRLLQVHLCIIYFIAGISKLQGISWWQGTATWAVLANFEFAPMNRDEYNAVLRFLGQNQLLFDSVITGAGLFTLAFEIGYPFLIWKPSTRWLFLVGAIMLHGLIGLFMGLKTFSLLMLVFNMAFLRTEEVNWMLRGIGLGSDPAPSPSNPAVTSRRKPLGARATSESFRAVGDAN